MVIEAIIRAPRAWTSARQLAKRYGAAAVAECAKQGIIECWDHDRTGRKLHAPAWTLTPDGARLYGVHVAEVPDPNTGLGVPFWSDGDDEEGVPKRPARMSTPRRAAELAGGRVKGAVVKDEEGNPLVVLGVEARADPRMAKRRMGKRRKKGRGCKMR